MGTVGWRSQVLPLLASRVRHRIETVSASVLQRVEEVRLRPGQNLVLELGDEQLELVLEQGPVNKRDLAETINLLSQYSLYAYAEQMALGYLTVAGGHRIGLAGRMVVEAGRITAMAEIGSLNFRIARQILGVGDCALPWLMRGRHVYNTLVVAPPRCGKTTLLRDLVRQLSAGRPGYPGINVGLVDERSELAGCYQGVPQLDVGPRTDVLDGCPKEYGLLMIVRSMGPQVVAADELGHPGDVAAIETVLSAGVSVLCTAHASDLNEATQKPVLGELLARGCFQRLIVMARYQGKPELMGIMALPQKKWLFRRE